MRSPDTLSLRRLTFPRSERAFPEPFVLVRLESSGADLGDNFQPVSLRAALFYQLPVQERIGPLSSLRHQTYKEDRWNLLTTALGVVQVGGEAYLVYRALKKYGHIH